MQGIIYALLSISLLTSFSCADVPSREAASDISIVGGRDTTQPYPFFVNLTETISDGTEEAVCAGTHIAPGFVVTAAHCIDGYEEWTELSFEENVKVVFHQVSADNLGTSDKGLIRAKIVATLVHPQYSLEDLHSPDIALIQYDLGEFPPGGVPVIAKLAMPAQPPASVPSATVIGFGMTDVHKNLWATHLQEAVVERVDHEVCSQIKSPVYEGLPNHFLCFGDFDKGSVDACFGDSGGPLFYYDAAGDAVIIGVTSFGPEYECGIAGEPGVYSSIAYFKDWIEEALADATIWKKL
jgi:secreted trypsin-like serine protease